MVTHRRWRGGGAHEEVGEGFQGSRKCGARSQASKVYGGAAAQVVKSHVHRQKAQGLSRELRALLPPAPPAGVGIEMLPPRGRGIKPIEKACGASARERSSLLRPMGGCMLPSRPSAFASTQAVSALDPCHSLAPEVDADCPPFPLDVQVRRLPSASPSSWTRRPQSS